MLEIEGLTRRFATKTAVESISLGVPAGQMVGVIGRSGAGKSTFLRMGSGDGGDGPRCGADRLGGLGGEFFLADAIDLADADGREVVRRAVEDEPAGIERDDAVAIVAGGGEVVQVHQDGDALAVHAAQRFHDDA